MKILEEETVLELPYIYYPGYEIKINNENVKSFESENGFLAITINKIEDANINVKYRGTLLMGISKIISIITFISIIIYLYCKKNNIDK